MSTRRILKGARLLDPARGLDRVGTVVVEDGRVAVVATEGEGPVGEQPGDQVEDLRGAWLAPGLVDLRASLREPGFEYKEDVVSGLRAAASGGFTAVCATPDTDPVTDNAAVVAQVLERARAAGAARLWPMGAATANLADETLAAIGELAEAGCVAVTQGERPVKSARLMRRVLEYSAMFDLPVASSAVEPTLGGICDEGPWSTRLGLPASPAAAEVMAVARDLALAELTGARLHLTRISTAGALALVARAKERGVPVTCDVTAHHLTLTASALQTFDPNAKVWPPLRSEADRDALRQAVASGLVDAVVSDHQPHHERDKAFELDLAATGIMGLELALPLVLRLVADGALTPLRAVEVLSTGPRRVLGRAGDAGLTVGAPADLTAIDPRATWIPDGGTLRSRARNSPFVGQVARGRAVLTMVGGQVVWRSEDAAEGGREERT